MTKALWLLLNIKMLFQVPQIIPINFLDLGQPQFADNTLAYEATQVFEEYQQVQVEGSEVPSIETVTKVRIKPELLDSEKMGPKENKFWNDMIDAHRNSTDEPERSGVPSAGSNDVTMECPDQEAPHAPTGDKRGAPGLEEKVETCDPHSKAALGLLEEEVWLCKKTIQKLYQV